MRNLNLLPRDQPLQSEAALMARLEELIEQLLRTRHQPEDDEFLHAECLRDLERGAAGPLITLDEMNARS